MLRVGLQIVQGLRVGLVFAVEELDGALVLQAAIDGHLLSGALRFKRDARHFDVQRDRDGRGHHEYQQQRKARLAARCFLVRAFIRPAPLPAAAFVDCCS